MLAIFIFGAMLYLGFWQLDRAQQKRDLQKQRISQSQRAPADLLTLLNKNDLPQRYQNVSVVGHYIDEGSVLIDNQIVDSKVGYWLLTPFLIDGSDKAVLVNRGWLAAGDSRDQLPEYQTQNSIISITGRSNKLPVKPAFWQDKYPINQGKVWQFLPRQNYIADTGINVLPLMLELAPQLDSVGGYYRQWPAISDQWVAKHQGYAFQWFCMALAFAIACLVLLLRGKSITE